MAVPPGHVYTLALGSLEILKLEDDNFEPLAGMDLPSGQLTGAVLGSMEVPKIMTMPHLLQYCSNCTLLLWPAILCKHAV